MKELNDKNKKLVICGVVLLVVILLAAGYYMYRIFFVHNQRLTPPSPIEGLILEKRDYNTELIREINANADKNYLISPYWNSI